MTSIELTCEQRKLIDKIAAENGFVYYQIDTVAGSAKGDNYLGVIKSVTIKGAEKKLKLIVKSAHVGNLRNHMPIRQAYLREIFVYEQVFPKFEEFQKEFDIADPFQSHAKLYGSCDMDMRECLVLEDLRDTGFGLWNRKLPMDHNHLAAVIKEYAKFHAVSLAMKEKKPEDYNKLTKHMEKHTFEEYIENEEKANRYMESVMGNVWEVFQGDSVTTDILKELEKKLRDLMMAKQSKYMVIIHGDCWCNNLLFGYQNEGSPTLPSDVCIIDWQLSKTSSPALDLAYFFLVHSPKDELQNYESYLKLYHNTLEQNLRKFSCDTEKIFPFSALLREWEDQVKIGLYFSFMVLKLMLCDSEEAPDFSKISDNGKDMLNFFDFSTKEPDTYSTRIKYLVEFCITERFL